MKQLQITTTKRGVSLSYPKGSKNIKITKAQFEKKANVIYQRKRFVKFYNLFYDNEIVEIDGVSRWNTKQSMVAQLKAMGYALRGNKVAKL